MSESSVDLTNLNPSEWLAAICCAHAFLTLPFEQVPEANKDDFIKAAAELLEGLLDRSVGETPRISERTAELLKLLAHVSSNFAKGAMH